MLRKNILDNPNAYDWEPDPAVITTRPVVQLVSEDWPWDECGCGLQKYIEYHDLYMTTLFAYPVKLQRQNVSGVHVVRMPKSEHEILRRQTTRLLYMIKQEQKMLKSADALKVEKLSKKYNALQALRILRMSDKITVKQIRQLIEGMPEGGILEIKLPNNRWKTCTTADLRILKARTPSEDIVQQLVIASHDHEDETRL